MSALTILNVIAITCAGGLWGFLITRVVFLRSGSYQAALVMAVGASVLAFGVIINEILFIAVPGNAIMVAGLMLELRSANQRRLQ